VDTHTFTEAGKTDSGTRGCRREARVATPGGAEVGLPIFNRAGQRLPSKLRTSFRCAPARSLARTTATRHAMARSSTEVRTAASRRSGRTSIGNKAKRMTFQIQRRMIVYFDFVAFAATIPSVFASEAASRDYWSP